VGFFLFLFFFFFLAGGVPSSGQSFPTSSSNLISPQMAHIWSPPFFVFRFSFCGCVAVVWSPRPFRPDNFRFSLLRGLSRLNNFDISLSFGVPPRPGDLWMFGLILVPLILWLCNTAFACQFSCSYSWAGHEGFSHRPGVFPDPNLPSFFPNFFS